MNAVFRLAGREIKADLRQGFGGWRIFLACLILGVGAIAAAEEMAAAVKAGLRADARNLLGGDLSISQIYRPLGPEALSFLAAKGEVSSYVEMRAMARSEDGQRSLVELKAVDDAYPLAGELTTEPPLARPIAQGDAHAALADPNLLDRLGVKIGDFILLGGVKIRVDGVIRHEPDKVASPFQLGPRLMVAKDTLAASGLSRPGAIERHVTLLSLPDGASGEEAREGLERKFPDAHWRVRGLDEAAPGLQRFLDNLSLFLTLTGLTGLLVGGVGVANAVRSQLDAKLPSIAILKSLGADNRQLIGIFGLETLTLAVLGVGLGLALGTLTALVASGVAASALPVRPVIGVYPLPLLKSGLAGLLVTLSFATPAIVSTLSAPVTSALRAKVAGEPLKRRLLSLLSAAPFALLLVLLVVSSAANRFFALWFVLAALASLLLFRLLAWMASWLAKINARHVASPALRLALGQLHRPGSPAASVIVSLGLGLAVLTTLAQIESNLRYQIEARVPNEAPAFFFIDIQPQQESGFMEAAASQGARDVQLSRMIRGRVTSLNGVPANQAEIDPSAKWALDGDRGFSTAPTMPEGTHLIEGQWWTPDHQGPPLVSVDARLAKGLGLAVGSRVGFDVLGRPVEAQVASLRDIDWSAASMNFAFLFTPNALEGAPYTLLATAKADAANEAAIERAVTDLYPNISSIRVKDALQSVRGVLEGAGAALAVMAAVTLPSGGLVLAGAIAAGQRRRIYESVVLKVLGADGPTLIKAYLAEFFLLGVATILLAGGIGTLCAYGVVDRMMHMPWSLRPQSSLLLLSLGFLATLIIGHLATAKALRAKPAPYLRNE